MAQGVKLSGALVNGIQAMRGEAEVPFAATEIVSVSYLGFVML